MSNVSYSPIMLPAVDLLHACKGEAKDLLFVLVERFKFCVLEYDAASGKSCKQLHLTCMQFSSRLF